MITTKPPRYQRLQSEHPQLIAALEALGDAAQSAVAMAAQAILGIRGQGRLNKDHHYQEHGREKVRK